ncbi:MAG: HAMP domain-containing sensor histidine kinase, partial [Candidatus Delongbacteria bacterium]|nr:HAMP domain-containing sensor histidine kinase [Candidatus Delongbacteria bacterium]
MSCHNDQDKANAKNTISGLEKKINLDFLTKEMPEALSQTKDGLARIRKIVNAMKQYSNMNLEEKKAADLNKTLENAEIITRNEWKYHAELVNEFDPELPFCECYEPELNQVFMNLIVNAAHATKDAVDQKLVEKGIITVKTSHKDGRIIITIADNGTGIPEKIRERVYDPFFTTKEVGKGTGQGLAIAHKAVVDRHGGKIWFETEQNKGTTFYIEVPV